MSIPESALQFDAKIVGMGEIDASGMNTSSEEEQKQQPPEQQMNAEEEALDKFEDFDIEKHSLIFLIVVLFHASEVELILKEDVVILSYFFKSA